MQVTRNPGAGQIPTGTLMLQFQHVYRGINSKALATSLENIIIIVVIIIIIIITITIIIPQLADLSTLPLRLQFLHCRGIM